MTDIKTGRSRPLAQKQQASSSEILDAAAKAFARRGYSATSIDDIADELGCTKGRIYHYFRAKGDLFIGIHRRALEWALEAIEPHVERRDLSPTERLRLMVRGHITHMMEHTDYMGPSQYHTEVNLAREGRDRDGAVEEIFRMRRAFEKHFVDVISEGVSAGEFRPCDPSLMAKAVLGPGNWMSVWYHAGSKRDTARGRSEIAEQFSDFVVSGLLAD